MILIKNVLAKARGVNILFHYTEQQQKMIQLTVNEVQKGTMFSVEYIQTEQLHLISQHAHIESYLSVHQMCAFEFCECLHCSQNRPISSKINVVIYLGIANNFLDQSHRQIKISAIGQLNKQPRSTKKNQTTAQCKANVYYEKTMR